MRISNESFAHGEPLTISAGVATFPRHADALETLEHRADGALYHAKQNGKNRCCFFDPELIRMYSSDELERRAEHQARRRAAENLVRVVDAKDAYTGAHSERVALFVEGIARRLGLDDELVEQLKLAGRLHDLGKIAISDRVLQKPSALTPEEMRHVATHSELGASLLDGMEIRPVDVWIRHHHEHWDGSGYPDGLAGEEIPFGSRVILVADAYDAMTTHRSYRTSSLPEDALAELTRLAGIQFDPVVVAALKAHLEGAGIVSPREGGRKTSLELVA
jgi:HD-GYP domain-containing protein (c-di-GMP phosphodiesterase class II)